ncbi:MAG: hypothetical protein K0U93_18115 [Gammaproteobacteria bacterium]|nr:hypothetical protein [Gammaproteobacteria bacterium]
MIKAGIQRLAVALTLLGVGITTAHAVGTGAGSLIRNTATANYQVGGVAATPVTGVVDITVDELIDVEVSWQDGANVVVSSPDTGDVLTFRVTNTGNGSEAFGLTTVQNLTGDQYDPNVTQVFIESNGTPGLQTTGATPDTAATNTGALAADANLTVYVVSDTPGSLTNGNTGNVQLTAQATTAGADTAARGATLTGLGDGGVDAIVGEDATGGSGANHEAIGTYVVSTVTVALTKSVVSIVDPFGGTQEIPGARINYQIQVVISGTGTADNLIITDPIPANTTYAPNSIFLNTVLMTDAQDTDAADFGLTAANTVTANLGNVTAGTHVILLSVTIN